MLIPNYILSKNLVAATVVEVINDMVEVMVNNMVHSRKDLLEDLVQVADLIMETGLKVEILETIVPDSVTENSMMHHAMDTLHMEMVILQVIQDSIEYLNFYKRHRNNESTYIL